MPSFIPRKEPIRKKGQLDQKKLELEHALRNNFSNEKLNKAIESYRNAKLNLLKAIIHDIIENEYKQKIENRKQEKTEMEIFEWMNKSAETIINDFKKLYNIK